MNHIVGISEIAAHCGVSRQAVGNWTNRFGDWPKPAATLKMGTVYWWLDVAAFLLEHPELAKPERIARNKASAVTRGKR